MATCSHFGIMRIIKESFLRQMAKRHPSAAANLERWIKITRAATWGNLVQLRATFPHADSVTVESGRTIMVFNICKNDYRLIAAVHFKTQLVYTLRFFTHAEYDKNKWKEEL